MMTKIPIDFPTLIAIVSALLAYAGWSIISDDFIFVNRARRISNQIELAELQASGQVFDSKPTAMNQNLRQALSMVLAFIAAFLISLATTTSLEISLAISLLVTSLPFILARRKLEKLRKSQDRSWPVAIDSVISSLQAGQSISEAVRSVATHGPTEVRPIFIRISAQLESGELLENALEREILRVSSGIADQTLTALILAKEFGGRDITTTLRMLSNFLREENEALEEIDTRFGWVRNSAVLGAVAPWLLLALLSTQRNTVLAYQSNAGRLVLSFGVIATAAAFLWMERVSRLPESPRPLRPRRINEIRDQGQVP